MESRHAAVLPRSRPAQARPGSHHVGESRVRRAEVHPPRPGETAQRAQENRRNWARDHAGSGRRRERREHRRYRARRGRHFRRGLRDFRLEGLPGDDLADARRAQVRRLKTRLRGTTQRRREAEMRSLIDEIRAIVGPAGLMTLPQEPPPYPTNWPKPHPPKPPPPPQPPPTA